MIFAQLFGLFCIAENLRTFLCFFSVLCLKYAHTFTGSVRGSESAEKESNAVTVQSTSTVTKKETKTEQTQTDKK